jgi:hypothetical protein
VEEVAAQLLVVPPPEELGIRLPDAPVVVPSPGELGIELE